MITTPAGCIKTCTGSFLSKIILFVAIARTLGVAARLNPVSYTHLAEELPKAQSKFKEFVQKFMKRKTAVISLAFIVFIILMAIIGPYVVPYDPQAPDYTCLLYTSRCV